MTTKEKSLNKAMLLPEEKRQRLNSAHVLTKLDELLALRKEISEKQSILESMEEDLYGKVTPKEMLKTNLNEGDDDAFDLYF